MKSSSQNTYDSQRVNEEMLTHFGIQCKVPPSRPKFLSYPLQGHLHDRLFVYTQWSFKSQTSICPLFWYRWCHVLNGHFTVYIFPFYLKNTYLFDCIGSCGTQDLQFSLQHLQSLVMACGICFLSCGMQDLQLQHVNSYLRHMGSSSLSRDWLNPGPLHWEHADLASRLPEKYLHFSIW